MYPDRIGPTEGGAPLSSPPDLTYPLAAGAPRLMAGTGVWTLDGVMPVEYLCAGDRIVTRGRGYLRLRATGIVSAVIPLVRVPAHALGPQRPDRDVILPADQALHLRGSLARSLFGTATATVPARALVATGRAELRGMRPVSVIRLDLGTPDILYAAGLEIAGLPEPA
ncbi:Hint domain-containing protein [Marinibacterium profundimaris]|nr:Hint domain-containing protein [Marinibacterium profundimaris]